MQNKLWLSTGIDCYLASLRLACLSLQGALTGTELGPHAYSCRAEALQQSPILSMSYDCRQGKRLLQPWLT